MEADKYISKEIPILKEQLISILKDEESKDGVVVSLQGGWGIGKTFFWNNFAEHTWKQNQHVYISLFGKHSLEEIKKQILLKIFDRNKIANFIDKNPVLEKIIEKKWGLDASLIASAFTAKTFKGIVLCFDDFERISPNLSLSEVMGFISELKEQNKCKIVIINNNDSLKEQDELNHEKRIEIGEKGEFTTTKHITTKTNNQEIFNLLSEKIIDYRLKYMPSIEDNLNLVKDESIEFVNWDLVKDLLYLVNNENKKYNIRLMKQFVSKLKLFESSLNSSIDESISNSITEMIFSKVFDMSVTSQLSGYKFTNIVDSLISFLNDVLEKHYLDKENFEVSLKKLNDILASNSEVREIFDKKEKIWHKHLNDLQYKEEDFTKELYELFNDNKKDIVRIIGASGSFESYIEVMAKIDITDRKKYNDLYVEAMQNYIDDIIDSKEELPYAFLERETSFLQKNENLKKYYEEKKNELVLEKITDMDSIINAMKKPKIQKGWGPDDENLLNSISTVQHIQWMEENSRYFQTCFEFALWIKGFSGTKPFETAYNNIVEAIKKLGEKPEYKNKLEHTLNFFKQS